MVQYRELWSGNRHYRYFFFGQIISFLGDWFTTIALYSAVAELTNSALALTLVVVSKTMPVFLIAPLAGPLVDRVDRRSLLLLTDLGRGILALAFIAMHQLHSLAGLYLVTVASTLLAGIAIPCKQAVLPRIVSAGAYPAANAIAGASWASMLTIGAALGGVVTALVGIDMSFVIDALTFALSASFFYRLPPQPPANASRDATRFSEALRYLSARPAVATQTMIKTCQSLGGGVFALIPIFGGGLFADKSGALWLGLLYAIRGFGTLIGTLWFRVLLGDSPSKMRAAIAVAFACQALTYYLLSQVTSFFQACLCYGLSGLLQGVVWVFAGTLLQAAVDPRYHGRVFALDFGGMTLTLGVSSMLAGFFVDAGMGAQEVVGMMAPLPLIGLLLAFYVWRAER